MRTHVGGLVSAGILCAIAATVALWSGPLTAASSAAAHQRTTAGARGGSALDLLSFLTSDGLDWFRPSVGGGSLRPAPVGRWRPGASADRTRQLKNPAAQISMGVACPPDAILTGPDDGRRLPFRAIRRVRKDQRGRKGVTR